MGHNKYNPRTKHLKKLMIANRNIASDFVEMDNMPADTRTKYLNKQSLEANQGVPGMATERYGMRWMLTRMSCFIASVARKE